VIHEIDEALRSLVREKALPGSSVDVSFEAPTKDWAARRNAPTVNVYLYDIREDLRRRSRGLVNEYDERRRVVARTAPPRYIKLSYLLTAWTQRPEDEHRLLSALLLGFIKLDAVPRELLTGSVADLGMPVPMTTALPPPEDRAFADVWTAMGGELKPSLDVVVSTPLAAATPVEVGPPASEGVRLGVADLHGGPVDEPVGHHVPAPDGSATGAGPAATRPAMRRSVVG